MDLPCSSSCVYLPKQSNDEVHTLLLLPLYIFLLYGLYFQVKKASKKKDFFFNINFFSGNFKKFVNKKAIKSGVLLFTVRNMATLLKGSMGLGSIVMLKVKNSFR